MKIVAVKHNKVDQMVKIYISATKKQEHTNAFKDHSHKN